VVGAFHTEFPTAEHVAIGIDVGGLTPEARAAYESAGLEVDESVVLVAERLVQPLASIAAVTVRPLVSDADWEQRAELAHAMSPETPREQFLTYQRARDAHERRLVAEGAGQRFGAFLDDALVSTGGVFRTEPGIARFQSIETHPDHRRQGVAATLVHAAGRYALDEVGVDRLVIVAEEGGPAVGIYRRLGFVDVETQVAMEKRAPGWSDH
jgi:ribosomal protein S18 acetylase RimI-like enzyme